jgi:hypothetical protein
MSLFTESLIPATASPRGEDAHRLLLRLASFRITGKRAEQILDTYPPDDIIAGLCAALVRNYLNNVAKGKELLSPVVFQGGVAANQGIRRALQEALSTEIIVPPYYHVMGAIGAALLAKERSSHNGHTRFRGLEMSHRQSWTSGFQCPDCPNACDVVEVFIEGKVIARWGDRCGKRQLEEIEHPAISYRKKGG